jgi:DNA-binding beta-propeller fold protein YncE
VRFSIIAHKSLFTIFLLLEAFTPLTAGIIDLQNVSTKNFLISTAPTGCMPKGMKVDPVGNSLYVAEMCGKIDPITKKRVPSVSIFDLSNRALSKTLITPRGASKDGILANTEVTFTLDEQWGLITRAEGDDKSEIYKNFGLLTVVNTDTQKIAKYIPLNGGGSKIIATRPYVSEDTKHEQIVYVANYFTDNISIVDVTNLREDGKLDGTSHFKGLIPLHTNFRNPRSKGFLIAPRGIAFTPDGKYALVLATETGSLIIVDAIKHKQIAELAPISSQTAGRELNLRHIVVTNNGETAYIGHMRGNAISRIQISKLIEIISGLQKKGLSTALAASVWDEILIPFKSADGPKKILILEDYPKDHPNFPGGKWAYAHPNTIVLEPRHNRYLYVSHRTTTNRDDSRVDEKIMGKIDIIDIEKDRLVFSLVGGAQPTALEVSQDGNMLFSAGLINDKLYFYDLKKITELYEKGEP